MHGLLACLVAICVALTGCARKDANISDRDRVQAITQLARSVVASRGVPGIAIAVVRDGKQFQKVTVGYSNLDKNEQVSSTTPFQLASTTKIFSSTGVLVLVSDGKLHLDDPIGNYLAGLPMSWRKITIRQLLSHTSGLPDITRRTGELDLVANDWDKALAAVATKPFQFQPGTGWAYTQTNYALLQRLVEKLSGKSFEDFLNERLFRPLGMSNTFFPGPQRQCAVNYEQNRAGGIDMRDLSFPGYVHAAGGLCSSLDDLIAWSNALDSGKLLPPALAQEAWTPARLTDGSTSKVGGSMSYGLGWAVDTNSEHPWAGHSGGNSTAFRRYLKDGITIIVLHDGASDPDAIASSLARTMFQKTTRGSAQEDLWDAASNGDLEAAKAALQAGANVNALDTRSSRNGRYALNWAAIHNRTELARFLIDHGASINAQNLSGFTALHHAAEAGSIDVAKVLLDAGADPSVRNGNNETASDVATRGNHLDVANLIDARKHTK